jgi:hypothetical protein
VSQRERNVGLSQTGIPQWHPQQSSKTVITVLLIREETVRARGAEQRILPFFFVPKTLRKLACKEREKRDSFPHSNPFSQSPALGSTETFIPEETVNSRILDELAPNHHRARPYCGSG